MDGLFLFTDNRKRGYGIGSVTPEEAVRILRDKEYASLFVSDKLTPDEDELRAMLDGCTKEKINWLLDYFYSVGINGRGKYKYTNINTILDELNCGFNMKRMSTSNKSYKYKIFECVDKA